MAEEKSSQRLQRLLTRAQEYWLPADIASFRSAFETIVVALDTMAQYSFKLEDEPAYPTTIHLSNYRAENHE
jgi:hypothetical protein